MALRRAAIIVYAILASAFVLCVLGESVGELVEHGMGEVRQGE